MSRDRCAIPREPTTSAVRSHPRLRFNRNGRLRSSISFLAGSIIFNNSHFWDVLVSDIGILSVLALIVAATRAYGFGNVVKYYGIPWMQVTHWIVMITYLHHTDPSLPHFRQSVWNYQRGATATVDRDFLGWQGRFFLYNGTYLLPTCADFSVR